MNRTFTSNPLPGNDRFMRLSENGDWNLVVLDGSASSDGFESTYRFRSSEERDRSYDRTVGVLERMSRYKDLPYVYGGNSPRTLPSAMKNLLGKRQYGDGKRGSLPFEGGYDCSGWVQDNLRKVYRADVPWVKKLNVPMIWDHPEGKKVIYDKLEEWFPGVIDEVMLPGDIMVMKKGDEYHTGILIGDGRISECVGSKDPSLVAISDSEWKEWEQTGLSKEERGGLVLGRTEDYNGWETGILRF